MDAVGRDRWLRDDVVVGAGGVVFVFTVGEAGVGDAVEGGGLGLGAGDGAPVPDPVEGVGALALRDGGGQLHVGFAPEFVAGAGGLAGLVVGPLLHAVGRDGSVKVILVAAAVVEGLSG